MSNYVKKKKSEIKIPRCCGHRMVLGKLDGEDNSKKALLENFKNRNKEKTQDDNSSDIYSYNCPYCGKSVLAKETGELLSMDETNGMFDNNRNQLPEGITMEMIQEEIGKQNPKPKQQKVIRDIVVKQEQWEKADNTTLADKLYNVYKSKIITTIIPMDDFIPEVKFSDEDLEKYQHTILPYALGEGDGIYIYSEENIKEDIKIDYIIIWTEDEWERVCKGENKLDILSTNKDDV